MEESRRASPATTRRRISSSVTRGARTTYSGNVPAASRMVSSTARAGAALARAAVIAHKPAAASRHLRKPADGSTLEHAELEVFLGVRLDVEHERVESLQAL